ncbi:MAG: M20/M25/M40 family metallo-hydrolase [Ignavibacteriaceae bacterium]
MDESQNSITIPELKRHLEFLGSDLFEGRGTGTTGGNLASKYIALEFDRIKLTPAGTDNTYYQFIPMHGSKPLDSSQLMIYYDQDSVKLNLNVDYLLYTSGEQTYIPAPIEMVFAGYGIIAHEFDYNDYQSIDVTGKIVLILDGEPQSEEISYFDGKTPTIYSYPDVKHRLAVSRGASGSLIVPNPYNGVLPDWDELINQFGFEDVTLASTVAGNLNAAINPDIADKILKLSGTSLDNIYKDHLSGKLKSFPLRVSLSFKGEFKQRDFVDANVIGMIEGSDKNLKDTYIIISAHYDHLGIGPVVNGDSIYNGVLDNAIGTAGLIELADAFSRLKPSPKRSLIFLAVTGEEKGLLGSTYYTGNPVVPLYKTIANVNIDGLSLFKDFTSVVAVGGDLSTLGDLFAASAEKMNISIANIPPQFKQLESFNRSDQAAFARAGIPSILILEGPDNKNLTREQIIDSLISYSKNIYHSPFDDLNLNIDLTAAVQHLQLLFRFIYDIADSDAEPQWNEQSPFLIERLRTRAEKR